MGLLILKVLVWIGVVLFVMKFRMMLLMLVWLGEGVWKFVFVVLCKVMVGEIL